MMTTLEGHEERGDERCIVFLRSDAEQRGGLELYGYDSDSDAISDLLIYLRMMFAANGRQLVVAPLRGES